MIDGLQCCKHIFDLKITESVNAFGFPEFLEDLVGIRYTGAQDLLQLLLRTPYTRFGISLEVRFANFF